MGRRQIYSGRGVESASGVASGPAAGRRISSGISSSLWQRSGSGIALPRAQGRAWASFFRLICSLRLTGELIAQWCRSSERGGWREDGSAIDGGLLSRFAQLKLRKVDMSAVGPCAAACGVELGGTGPFCVKTASHTGGDEAQEPSATWHNESGADMWSTSESLGCISLLHKLFGR